MHPPSRGLVFLLSRDVMLPSCASEAISSPVPSFPCRSQPFFCQLLFPMLCPYLPSGPAPGGPLESRPVTPPSRSRASDRRALLLCLKVLFLLRATRLLASHRTNRPARARGCYHIHLRCLHHPPTVIHDIPPCQMHPWLTFRPTLSPQ